MNLGGTASRPHITDESSPESKLIGETADVDGRDVEIGGRVGDIESLPFSRRSDSSRSTSAAPNACTST